METQNNSTENTENETNGTHCKLHISESEKTGQLFQYNGEEYLPINPSCNNIITENDDYGSTKIIKRVLSNKEDITFMPVDIEEYNEYINNTSHYVLRIYGCLVNGEKAVVTISGIKVFFDIRLPDDKTVNVFKTEIKDIFRNGKDDEGETIDINKIRIEHVKAFPICGYHAEKKSYLRIYTTTTFLRKIALNIILKHNLETASDDRSAYYRKVSREYRIPLSGWALLTNLTT